MSIINKISTYFVFFSGILILMHCQRIEPDKQVYQANELVTSLNDRLSILDTTSITFDHSNGSISYFKSSSSFPVITKGDLVAYHTSSKSLYGRVINILTDGVLTGLEIENVHMNDLFHFFALHDTLRTVSDNYLISLGEGVEQIGDTLYMDHFTHKTRNGVIVTGIVNIDSLRIVEQAQGENFAYMGPAWPEDITLKSYQLEWNQNTEISAYIRLYALDGDILHDSLLLRTRVFSSSDGGGVAVDFKVEDWLVFEWFMPGTSTLNLVIDMTASTDFYSKFDTDNLWHINSLPDLHVSRFDLIDWNKTHSVEAKIHFITRLIPEYCGQAGSVLEKDILLSTKALAEWPQWEISNELGYSARLISNTNAFNEIPDLEIERNSDNEIVYAESGVLENEPPVAAFDISPSTGYTNTDYKLNASASSDHEDTKSLLEVRWDFDGDESWDTQYSTIKLLIHQFLLAGTYEIRMQVKDTQGATSIAKKTLLVHETTSAPIAAFSVLPESGKVAEFFTFDASGCYDAEDPLSSLEVRWDFQNDGEWDSHFSTSKAAVWVYDTPQTYVVKLEVRDSDGLTGSTTKLLTVENANIKPTAFYTINPESGTTETRFGFDASGSSDTEDSIEDLQVRWDWENDGVWDTGYRLIKTITHQFAVKGVYTTVLEVLDTEGYSNTYSLDILVTNPNTPPTADFSIDPTDGTINTKFTFDASISTDKEDDTEALQVRWDWDNDDVYDTEYSSTKVLTRQFSETGTYIIKVMVKDSGGLTSTKARLVTVQ
ncbi:MAG: hypothetical protein J7L96_09770, partial [Bacteroidales bacterium]|nr:hypothetical protein [Bacteroidales bacterium]